MKMQRCDYNNESSSCRPKWLCLTNEAKNSCSTDGCQLERCSGYIHCSAKVGCTLHCSKGGKKIFPDRRLTGFEESFRNNCKHQAIRSYGCIEPDQCGIIRILNFNEVNCDITHQLFKDNRVTVPCSCRVCPCNACNHMTCNCHVSVRQIAEDNVLDSFTRSMEELPTSMIPSVGNTSIVTMGTTNYVSSSPMTGAIVGAIVPIIFFAFVIVGLVIWKHHLRKKNKETDMFVTGTDDNVYDIIHMGNVYANIAAGEELDDEDVYEDVQVQGAPPAIKGVDNKTYDSEETDQYIHMVYSQEDINKTRSTDNDTILCRNAVSTDIGNKDSYENIWAGRESLPSDIGNNCNGDVRSLKNDGYEIMRKSTDVDALKTATIVRHKELEFDATYVFSLLPDTQVAVATELRSSYNILNGVTITEPMNTLKARAKRSVLVYGDENENETTRNMTSDGNVSEVPIYVNLQ